MTCYFWNQNFKLFHMEIIWMSENTIQKLASYFQLNRFIPVDTPLCWKSNNPGVQAPWRNFLPYESMAKSECFCQNRIALTLWPFLQINPEKMTSLQMCRIKKITPCSIQTFWDRQLCFYVKKLFVSEKTQKSELFHFS